MSAPMAFWMAMLSSGVSKHSDPSYGDLKRNNIFVQLAYLERLIIIMQRILRYNIMLTEILHHPLLFLLAEGVRPFESHPSQSIMRGPNS